MTLHVFLAVERQKSQEAWYTAAISKYLKNNSTWYQRIKLRAMHFFFPKKGNQFFLLYLKNYNIEEKKLRV